MAIDAERVGRTMTAQFESVMVKLCSWLFFGVLFAVLPVLIDAMAEMTRGGTVRWANAVDRGELLIAAAAVSALSAAEHVTRPQAVPRFWPTLLVCMNLTVVVASTTWYSHLGGLLRDGHPYDGGLVAAGSLGVFAAAVGSGFFSTVWVARREAQNG